MAARGSTAWRKTAWGQPCAATGLVVLDDWMPGIRLAVHADAVPAFLALATVLKRHEYTVRRIDTGSYNCRKIKGSNAMSSHAWGVAVDINWTTNPYSTRKLMTDMPRAMIDDIEALRTATGAPVWRWGGDWDGRPHTGHSNYDAMHFEIVATPGELASGVIDANSRVDIRLMDPRDLPLLSERRASKGDMVGVLQRVLGVTPTHEFDAATVHAVRLFQHQHGLSIDGIVGPATWRKLLEHVQGGPE